MEDRQKRREARKIQQQRQASGCMGLLITTTVLLAGLAILWVLNWPVFSGGTTELLKNPYGPEDFITVNGHVTCTAGHTRRGLDVSEYQGDIDWDRVYEAGYDFVFIRLGYRGYSVGDIFPDDRALENLAGAKAAGLDVGAYFYAQAISPAEAAEEAQWCLDLLAGESLDLPLVYDWEWVGPNARTGAMNKATLTECAKTFCAAIETAGYTPMIYFNNHVSRDLLDLKALEQYPFWLAQYKDQMDYPYQVDFWQYTESGKVPGIEGDVDIDLMFIYE